MKILALTLMLAVALPLFADRAVRGHVRRNGSTVQSHRRTSANRTQVDNYSSKGNTNPYTGKRGTRTPKR